ncbi:MAG: hypothetical protein QOI92_2848 [Chloroflexota bacterium]|nr:hypothetical protein [Chloroflexota bacterium]
MAVARGASIGQAARQAATDFYFNSLRFVPANVAWSLAALVVLFAGSVWPPAIVLVVLLAIPLAGIHRLAALLARGEPASLGDFVDGMRRSWLHATGVGVGLAIVAAVLVTNLVTGFTSGNPLGWFVGATALWGLVALVMFAVAIWPALVDPRHEGASLRRRVQLAGLVVIGRPGRLFALTALVVAILAVSTVVLGAIVLAAVSYACILATRWVLPAIDELEARYEAARTR